MGRSGRFVASTDSLGEVDTLRRANTRDYRRPGPCNEFPALSARCSSCDVAVTEPVAYVQPAQTTLLGPGDDQAPEAADAGHASSQPGRTRARRSPARAGSIGRRRSRLSAEWTRGHSNHAIRRDPDQHAQVGSARSSQSDPPGASDAQATHRRRRAISRRRDSHPAAGSDELAARRAFGEPAGVGACALRQVPAIQPNFRTEAARRADRTSKAAPCPAAGSAFARARCRRSSRAVQHRPRRASASIWSVVTPRHNSPETPLKLPPARGSTDLGAASARAASTF